MGAHGASKEEEVLAGGVKPLGSLNLQAGAAGGVVFSGPRGLLLAWGARGVTCGSISMFRTGPTLCQAGCRVGPSRCSTWVQPLLCTPSTPPTPHTHTWWYNLFALFHPFPLIGGATMSLSGWKHA
jgi:hypothetical protein